MKAEIKRQVFAWYKGHEYDSEVSSIVSAYTERKRILDLGIDWDWDEVELQIHLFIDAEIERIRREDDKRKVKGRGKSSRA